MQVRKMYEDGTLGVIGDAEIYCHGGGFSGLWGIGMLRIMHTLEDIGAMKIHMLHGYSIGAIFAVFYACDISTSDAISAYHVIQTYANTQGLVRSFRESIKQILPGDAHVRCSGRIRIGMTQKLPCMWYNEISEFADHDALVDAIVQSASIPFVTASASNVVRNCIDGVVGHMLWGWSPPRYGRTGIELVPPCIGYSYIFSPSDPYVYGLIIHGITDIVYFLQGRHTKFVRRLQWMPWHAGMYSTIVDHTSWRLISRVSDRI